MLNFLWGIIQNATTMKGCRAITLAHRLWHEFSGMPIYAQYFSGSYLNIMPCTDTIGVQI